VGYDHGENKKWFRRQVRKSLKMNLYGRYIGIRSVIDEISEMKVTLGNFCDKVLLPTCKECAEERWSSGVNKTCCSSGLGFLGKGRMSNPTAISLNYLHKLLMCRGLWETRSFSV